MRKYHTYLPALIISFFFSLPRAHSQEPVWIKHIGSPTDIDVGASLCQNGDGTLMTTGYTLKPIIGLSNILLVKSSSDGSMLWSKVMSSSTFYNFGNKVLSTADDYNI